MNFMNFKPNINSIFSSICERTQFGREYEVVAKTMLDSHKAEQPANHWILVTDLESDANDE